MSKKFLKHTGSGKPIRGNDKPFRRTALTDEYEYLKNAHAVDPNRLATYRDILKDAVALLAQQDISSGGKKVPVIDNSCIDIIQDHFGGNYNPHVYGFISCTIDFFNNGRAHITAINQNCANCKSKRIKKSMKHLVEDCDVLSKRYVQSIITLLQNNRWENINPDDDFLRQFEAIPEAITFFTSLISTIFSEDKVIPAKITRNAYHNAVQFDSRFKSYYTLVNGEYYLATRVVYSSLHIGCAISVFCDDY